MLKSGGDNLENLEKSKYHSGRSENGQCLYYEEKKREENASVSRRGNKVSSSHASPWQLFFCDPFSSLLLNV